MDLFDLFIKFAGYLFLAPFVAIYLLFTMPLIGIPACIVVGLVYHWMNSGTTSYSASSAKDHVTGQYYIRERDSVDGMKNVSIWRL